MNNLDIIFFYVVAAIVIGAPLILITYLLEEYYK